jgi:hypothetical protein
MGAGVRRRRGNPLQSLDLPAGYDREDGSCRGGWDATTVIEVVPTIG